MNKANRKIKRKEKIQKYQYLQEKRQLQKTTEFSKVLLIQESILIWIMTIAFIILAFYCVINQFFGELPWLATMVAFPWTAYGVSQGFYYKKAQKENTKDGIKFETTLAKLNQTSINNGTNNNSNNHNTYNTYNNSYNSGTVIDDQSNTNSVG